VHLPGEPDAGNLIGAQGGASECFPHCDPAGTPPVFGVLFRPTNLRRGEKLVLLSSRCDDPAALADDYGASTAGANVNSENMLLHTVQVRCVAKASEASGVILNASHEKSLGNTAKLGEEHKSEPTFKMCSDCSRIHGYQVVYVNGGAILKQADARLQALPAR
jgi:hypothetical protein